jgi:hypothetical protein
LIKKRAQKNVSFHSFPLPAGGREKGLGRELFIFEKQINTAKDIALKQ